MTYIKINGTTYPAVINGKHIDREWNDRESKTITIEMAYADAIALFVDGLAWSIVHQTEVTVYQTDESGNPVLDETGAPIQIGTKMQENEYDNSEYCVAGPITDNRDDTISVKMGKPTQLEMMQAQLANAVTQAELNNAYVEGVNSL